MELEHKIEAVLFYKTKPVAIAWLLKFFETDEETLGNALVALQQNLRTRGVRLIVAPNHEVQLVTAPEFAATLEGLQRDELRKDVGVAGAETLAVILYRGPVSRSEIDRIRGVNSSFILRNLLIRGLIERAGADTDRSHRYQITPELLAHLGIEQREALPDYESIAGALDAFVQEVNAEDQLATTP
jgi:segregation and condensation protein B